MIAASTDTPTHSGPDRRIVRHKLWCVLADVAVHIGMSHSISCWASQFNVHRNMNNRMLDLFLSIFLARVSFCFLSLSYNRCSLPAPSSALTLTVISRLLPLPSEVWLSSLLLKSYLDIERLLQSVINFLILKPKYYRQRFVLILLMPPSTLCVTCMDRRACKLLKMEA